MNKPKEELKLLPPYFKIISFAIILVSLIVIIFPFSKMVGVEKELMKEISKNGLLVSLLLLALTRNKVEDELTLRIRLKALAVSFIFGVVYVIISPYTNLLFRGNFLSDKDVTTLLLSMLFFYFIMFYTLKKNR